ncbi:MAG: flagellar hook-associated protein FlgK [Pseudohongiellaceae bacterium]
MVDILRLGSNTLSSLQQAMTTTGHNIANVNTEGYSRQAVQFETQDYARYGFGFVGSGSRISSVDRSYNEFLTSQVQSFTSSQSQQNTFVQFASRVDNLLANTETSLNTSMQQFFGAMADVAASPSTLPERQALIGEANNLVDKQRAFYNMLQDLNTEVNSALGLAVNDINNLAKGISELNKQITSETSAGRRTLPNDLLDQRDKLIRQMSEKIGVTVNEQSDGSVNVFVGKGQPVVVGSQVTELQTETNAYDSSHLEVGIAGQVSNNGTSKFVTGGELQGLIDFRNRVLVPAQSQLGLVSMGLSESLNGQHLTGMDLNSELGGLMFNQNSISVIDRSTNAGTADPSVSLDDYTEVRPSEYNLSYDGTQWHLTRMSDNTSVSGAGPLSLDGMTVDVSVGTPSTGDSFRFNPAREAGAGFDFVINDPRKIAAASPISVIENVANTGTATMSGIRIDATNTLPFASSVVVTFNPDAMGAGIPGFDVTGGPGGLGPYAYDPATESDGKTISLGTTGVSFTAAEIPQAGDSFTIENNFGATGDNNNALSMSALQHQSLLAGGADTFQETYGAMVAQVGSLQRQGQANLDLETSLLQQAESYKDSVTGVNLDEEAANLMRYQQSYQAAAQLVKISEEMFQTLMNSLR